MNKSRKIILFAGLLCLCLLCGCIPQKYDKEKEKQVEDKGRVFLEEYAASLPGGGEITSLYMLIGYEAGGSPYPGSYLSDLVRARIKTPDRDVNAIVNIKTGEIFTDYYMQDVNKAVRHELQPYLERAGIKAENLQVSFAEIFRVIISPGMDTIHKSGQKIDSVVAFSDMIPSDITETDPEKWADIVLKNVKLSAFDVRFEADTAEFPGVSFLTDYLSESGNYMTRDENVFKNKENYRISVEVQGDPEITGWVMDASVYDTPDHMEFSVNRMQVKTEGAFTFFYKGADGTFSPEQNELKLTENDCPVTVEDDTLHYVPGEGSVQLIFTEKPLYTVFERTTYQDGQPKEPEELKLQQLPDGTWSLTDGRQTHENGYYFQERQDIRFR